MQAKVLNEASASGTNMVRCFIAEIVCNKSSRIICPNQPVIMSVLHLTGVVFQLYICTMKNQDFTTSLEVAATPTETFSAINNVRGWWSENIDGPTDRFSAGFSYYYEDVHRTRFKITEFVPGQKVVWHVLDNYFKFITDKNERSEEHT